MSLHDIVTKGSVDRSVTLRIIDSTDGTPETGVVFNTSGIDLWYRREGSALVSITEATLAALTTAHADGGFLHIANGEYRLDLPDAAFATGANHVDFGGTVTGMVVIGGRVRLVDYSLEDAVRMGLTALPNAAAEAAGGLFTRGTGAGQINQSANGQVDVNVAVMAANVITAAATATDFGTEVGTAVWATTIRSLTVLDEDTTTLDLDATIRAAVGLASANLDTQIAAVQSDTDNIQTRLPAALVSGRMDTNVGAMAADVLTASALAADAVTEIQTGLATSSALATVAGYVDTEVAAIKAKTDQLTFTVANQVDVNVVDWKGATAPAMTGDAFARLGAPAGASVSADIAAVAAKTTNLPTDPADESLIIAATDAIMTRLGAPAGASVSADIAAVKTDTAATRTSADHLDDTLELTSDGYIFTALSLQNAPTGSGGGGSGPTAVEIADEVQTRTIAAVNVVNGLAANVITAAATAADFTTEVTAALATSAALTSVAGDVTAVKAKTDNLPTDPADESLIIAATDAIMTRVGAPAGASISADIAAVAAKTTNLPSDPADASVVAGLIAGLEVKVDIVDANVDAVLLDTGTDGVVVAAGSKTGYRLSATGVDDVLDEVVEGTTTLRESVRLANAVLAGKASGLETTEATFRDLADTRDRVVATVDATGNRTAVVRDLT
jgi:hypothetical protein